MKMVKSLLEIVWFKPAIEGAGLGIEGSGLCLSIETIIEGAGI